jgi:threonine synthase
LLLKENFKYLFKYNKVGEKTGHVLKCINCGREYPISIWLFKCSICDSLLEVKLNLKEAKVNFQRDMDGIWRFQDLLPKVSEIVSLNEGNTPLIRSKEFDNLYFKFEGLNPTGSFKDRGMSVVVSLAKSNGIKKLIVASTGNTAASAAAYAARAGMECIVVIPKGKVAKGKLFQTILHGANIMEIEGNFDEAIKYVINKIEKEREYYPINSFNPWRIEGQKTLSFELYEKLGNIDNVIVPVGNGGNISAIWKGFKELYELKIISNLPKMIGVQAEGASPIAETWEKGLEKPIFFEKPETIATAIRIGKPVNWQKALKAVRESGGIFIKVKDEEIIEAQKRLARNEGIGAEPASAAAYAAYLKLKEEDMINKYQKTVVVLTGHALKDPG